MQHMNNEKSNITTTDERWGGYIPWFLRHQDFSGTGDFETFFGRLSQRLEVLFKYESGIPNLSYFAELLESESLQRFKKSEAEKYLNKSYNQIPWYFDPKTMNTETYKRNLRQKAIIERIGVLEVLLRILPSKSSHPSPKLMAEKLIQDIRKLFAEAKMMLDIRDDPPLIIPMEEPLLQKEVLDKLLPRLASQFPDRAKELIKAYHDSINGSDFNTVFSEAFKTLEEIAKSLTDDKKFMFNIKNLSRYFPGLHQTIHKNIEFLAGIRNDLAHTRSSPKLHEIRYLLFSICNIALLLLDYPKAPAAD